MVLSTLSGGALGSLASSLAKLFKAEEWNERTLPNHAIAVLETEVTVWSLFQLVRTIVKGHCCHVKVTLYITCIEVHALQKLNFKSLVSLRLSLYKTVRRRRTTLN